VLVIFIRQQFASLYGCASALNFMAGLSFETLHSARMATVSAISEITRAAFEYVSIL